MIGNKRKLCDDLGEIMPNNIKAEDDDAKQIQTFTVETANL
jgi:hypothetical protein